MIWFFQRRGDHLRCEVRTQIEGDRYELVITEPDGTERVESFADSASLNKRSLELERKWQEEGWTGPYMRFL
jgi:hypothetical protein